MAMLKGGLFDFPPTLENQQKFLEIKTKHKKKALGGYLFTRGLHTLASQGGAGTNTVWAIAA